MNIWSSIGVASIILILMSFLLDLYKGRHELKYERIFTEKEGRYRSILVFMSVVLDEENYNHISTEYKPHSDEGIREYYLNELRLHLKFARLYAPKVVLDAICDFIDNSTDLTYDAVPNELRQDLWARKLKL